MIKCNLHTHSTLCDGNDVLEDTVIAAIEKGFYAIGFSGHSFTDFDLRYCMSDMETNIYIANISVLKQKYKDIIEIYCGLEKDYLATDDRIYDYTIGSVHYFEKDGKLYDVDGTKEDVIKATEEFYGGDIYTACEEYFKTVADVKRKTGCDIIGHFDLIKKFNKDECLFSYANPRYIIASMDALNQLLKTDVIFELNTSGAFPERCGEMYLSDRLLKEIANKKGRVIITSDCHKKEFLDYGFEEARQKLKNIGFKTVCAIKGGKFIEENL